MFEAHIHELEALWNGKTHFSSTTINYTLSGKRIDVQLRGAILPGSETTFDRILITTEDITPYQNAPSSGREKSTPSRVNVYLLPDFALG